MSSQSLETQNTSSLEAASGEAAGTAADESQRRLESRRWWITLFVQPLLLLVCAAAAIAGLGLAQRLGWISSGGGHGSPTTVATAA